MLEFCWSQGFSTLNPEGPSVLYSANNQDGHGNPPRVALSTHCLAVPGLSQSWDEGSSRI